MFMDQKTNTSPHPSQCASVFDSLNTLAYGLEMSVKDVLEHEMTKRGLNAYDVERLSGVTQPTISRILSGKHDDPRTSTVQKLARAFGLTEYEMRGGLAPDTQAERERLIHKMLTIQPEDQPPFELGASSAGPAIHGHPVIDWDDPAELPEGTYVFVPRFNVSLSAGNGHVVLEEMQHEQPQAFRSAWMRQKGYRSADLICVYAKGDSMMPTIRCGASVLLNTGQKAVIDGGIYALRFGDEVRIKRLYRRPDGGLIIRSDNSSEYPDVIVTAPEMVHIDIIGRAVWQGGDL